MPVDPIERLGISPAKGVEIAGAHVAGRVPHPRQTVVVDHGIRKVEVVLPGPIPVNGHAANLRRVYSQPDVLDLIGEREINEEVLLRT